MRMCCRRQKLKTHSTEKLIKKKPIYSILRLIRNQLNEICKLLLFDFINWGSLSLPLSPSLQSVKKQATLQSVCVKLCHLDHAVTGSLLFARGESSLARHITLKNSISLSMSQPALGEV